MTDTIARALAARAKGFADKLFGGVVTSAAERTALQQALTAAGVTASDPLGRLGSRLRATYARSSLSNPLINAPYLAPAAYASSTTYAKGAVVLASGHLYVQLNTSGTTGATPPTWLTTAATIADGTCSWIYAGEPSILVNDPAAPALSTWSGSNTAFTGSVAWFPATYPNAYTVTGGAAVANGAAWTFNAFNRNSTTSTGKGVKISAFVEDAKFAVGTSSGAPPLFVAIDDRFDADGPLLSQAGTPNGRIYDFGASGRKRRRVDIYSGSAGSINFNGILTTATGIVSPADPSAIGAVFIADSYDDGSSYGPFARPQLATQMGMRLGWDVTHMAEGGTGVINPAIGMYTFPQRVADAGNAARIAAAKVVVLYGSTNDTASAPADITAAVIATLNGIRAANPTCPIIWFGPASINKTAGPTYAQILVVEQATIAAFASWADPAGANRAFFIPFATSSSTPIIGTYLTGYPAVQTQTTIINQGDLLHPSDYGTFVIARWMSEQIATRVLPVIA